MQEGEAAMTEATEFAIGTRASCSDGPCGELNRVIIDPAALTISHLVIQPKHRRGRGRLVPLDLVSVVGGEIRLSCTIAEFDNLDSAEERDLVAGPGSGDGGGYGSAGSVQGYSGLGVGSVSGAGTGTGLGRGSRTVVEHVVPLGETEVGRGEPVHALDGEIGRVEGFIVSPGDHQVTHVLLQEGHIWGRREIAIPMSAVTGAGDGIRLNITKEQVSALPPTSS
jgi:sporulation protein YlmC with PRC-barrel domain